MDESKLVVQYTVLKVFIQLLRVIVKSSVAEILRGPCSFIKHERSIHGETPMKYRKGLGFHCHVVVIHTTCTFPFVPSSLGHQSVPVQRLSSHMSPKIPDLEPNHISLLYAYAILIPRTTIVYRHIMKLRNIVDKNEKSVFGAIKEAFSLYSVIYRNKLPENQI